MDLRIFKGSNCVFLQVTGAAFASHKFRTFL